MKLNKKVAAIVSLALLGAATVAGTVAYIFTDTEPVQNTFTPASVTSEVDEDFVGIRRQVDELERPPLVGACPHVLETRADDEIRARHAVFETIAVEACHKV